MKRLILSTAFFLAIVCAKAQQKDSVIADTNKIFHSIDVEPSFHGGFEKFIQYLTENEKYPDAARNNNVTGKVFVTFIVEKDGGLSDVNIFKSLSAETDAEAIRLIKDSPKWYPGLQNGKPVRVQYTIPIPFPIKN